MTELAYKEIDAFSEKLWLAKRDLQSAAGIASTLNPVFVMLAKDEPSRREMEADMMGYFAKKYGFDFPFTKKYDINPMPNSSTFQTESR